MNKPSLRALPVLLALASASVAAQQEPTVYGVLDAAVMHVSNQTGHATTTVRSGNQLASRIGFKGTEDIGGGTQVLYVLEAGVNLANGASPQPGSVFNRQTFVGLHNDRFGTVTVGRQYPTYYLFVGLLVRAGAPTGATDAHPGDIDGLDAASRFSNAVGYTSPEWHGAQFGLVAGTGERGSTGGHDAASGDAFSAAARYQRGPWHAAVGYQLLKNGPDGATWDPNAAGSLSKSALNAGYLSAGSIRSIAAAASYKAGQVGISGAVSTVTYKPGAASHFTAPARFRSAGATVTWQTATPWRLGATLSTTHASAANGIRNPAHYRQVALEQIYTLSRRTSLYVVQARQLARGTTLNAEGMPVAAVAVVGDAQLATPSSNGRQNVFMAGVRHDF